MGKPSNRPEVPTIFIFNLQVARPVPLHDPIVEEREDVYIPSTGNIHEDCVAASTPNQICIGAPR